jgi:hypothetical protein
MRNIILSALLFLASVHCYADEDYRLYRVTCNKSIPSFQIESYVYWNIGHVIWPKRFDWPAHVAALQKLESEESLYAFHEDYAYYSEPHLKWKCGGFEVVLTFDKSQRENPKGPAFPPVFVRSYPRISVWSKGKKIVTDLPIAAYYAFRTYADYSGEPYIAICSGAGVCKDNLAVNWAPMTRESIDAVLAQPDL